MSTKEPTALEGTDRLPTDDLYKLLSNERRRHAVRFLLERGPVSKRHLVDYVASNELGKPADALTEKERKRVYVSLQQCHLPKIEDYDVLREVGERIEPGRHAHQLGPYLETDRSLTELFRDVVSRHLR